MLKSIGCNVDTESGKITSASGQAWECELNVKNEKRKLPVHLFTEESIKEPEDGTVVRFHPLGESVFNSASEISIALTRIIEAELLARFVMLGTRLLELSEAKKNGDLSLSQLNSASGIKYTKGAAIYWRKVAKAIVANARDVMRVKNLRGERVNGELYGRVCSLECNVLEGTNHEEGIYGAIPSSKSQYIAVEAILAKLEPIFNIKKGSNLQSAPTFIAMMHMLKAITLETNKLSKELYEDTDNTVDATWFETIDELPKLFLKEHEVRYRGNVGMSDKEVKANLASRNKAPDIQVNGTVAPVTVAEPVLPQPVIKGPPVVTPVERSVVTEAKEEPSKETFEKAQVKSEPTQVEPLELTINHTHVIDIKEKDNMSVLDNLSGMNNMGLLSSQPANRPLPAPMQLDANGNPIVGSGNTAQTLMNLPTGQAGMQQYTAEQLQQAIALVQGQQPAQQNLNPQLPGAILDPSAVTAVCVEQSAVTETVATGEADDASEFALHEDEVQLAERFQAKGVHAIDATDRPLFNLDKTPYLIKGNQRKLAAVQKFDTARQAWVFKSNGNPALVAPFNNPDGSPGGVRAGVARVQANGQAIAEQPQGQSSLAQLLAGATNQQGGGNSLEERLRALQGGTVNNNALYSQGTTNMGAVNLSEQDVATLLRAGYSKDAIRAYILTGDQSVLQGGGQAKAAGLTDADFARVKEVTIALYKAGKLTHEVATNVIAKITSRSLLVEDAKKIIEMHKAVAASQSALGAGSLLDMI